MMILYQRNIPTLAAGPVIEGYKSLIWTERFTEAGDFALTTGKIDSTMEQIPVGSAVSITDSKELMLVETHKVSTNEYGVSELTVSGRSFETFYERRPAINSFDPILDAEYHIPDTTPRGAIDTLLNIHPVNNTLWDTKMALPVSLFFPVDPREALLQNHDYQVPKGDVYSAVLEIARSYNIGLRTRAPYPDGGNGIAIDVYYGKNRTVSSTTDTPVLFSSVNGDFLSEEYLHTNVNHHNAIMLFTNNTANLSYTTYGGVSGNPASGLELRIKYVDASDIVPPEDTGIRDSITYETALAHERAAMHYVSDRLPRKDFSFQISPNSTYKFGVDYSLGDAVTVEGKYGGRKDLLVTEYIRSEDSNGETAYPTMVEIEDPLSLEEM